MEQQALELPSGEELRPSLPGARLRLWPHWLAPAAASELQRTLTDTLPWSRHRVHVFGRWIDAPRLSCWVGDADAVYSYSGARFEPVPWTSALAAVRDRVSQTCGEAFNSVLVNLYRDGEDAMGWHSDNERELGPEPVIASLSLGQPRSFRLRARHDHTRKLELRLGEGALLCMAGATQRLYQHAVPRSRRDGGTRINLTFRRIQPAARI
ncbi:alpha-ketoglutarate-dependent dioxygenase AlkB [Oleiagrimonas sp. C23AA]|uniref:alpha-ketoglutarate-dependent dioxygenase AlkB family protein n=1 Tax=Oleiagrimonas sp. C23AA TaxID=2719047 RepID=UPI0014226987|nr:alpha-ketoglutarate-dependent dioxygenase AlkB [Oleiagrimonas sp. C23AA]NII12124.1 alpha-ketoglutarate-dependent dioxygenase AlkB [Oleiagrimonas sp. C23AA]